MLYPSPDFMHKIIAADNLAHALPQIRDRGPIVFTNGCFDILHRGHVTYLAQARALGASLIVALNSDVSVKLQNKGDERPLNCLEDRMAVIASLQAVDYVISFTEDTPLKLILQIMPQVLVKGGDWLIKDIVGGSEVVEHGGQVHSIPFTYNTSTTKLIKQIRNYDL